METACNIDGKFQVRNDDIEPVENAYRIAIKNTPIRILHGQLDQKTSPSISKRLALTEGRHLCSGFHGIGHVGHDFGDLEQRANYINSFMDCVEGLE